MSAMNVAKKQRKAVLREYPEHSIAELAGKHGLSRRQVRKVLREAGKLPARSFRTPLIGLVILVVVLALAAAVSAWLRRPSTERLAAIGGHANLLLVTIDTCRADRLGCYGFEEARTPVIDELAGNGVRFSSAFALQPVTLPSHATIFTGTHPAYHGVADNGLFRVPEQARTLAEVLSEHGLATGAVISSFVLHRQFGLDQGFGHYDDHLGLNRRESASGYDEMPADVVTARALEWLGKHRDQRWFLWLHYFDPHGDYLPPPQYREGVPHPYDGELAFVDHELGRVITALRELDLDRKTLTVITSDHGEGLGEHDEDTHAMFLYDSTMHIPLILSLPGALQARVSDATVSLLDLMPTVLDILGIEPPPEVQGRSLRPLLFADPEQWTEKPVLMETRSPWHQLGWSPSFAIRDRSYKLIRAPRPELYDLAADAGEIDNIYQQHPEQVAALERALEEQTESFGAGAIGGQSWAGMDEETRERLAGLGYLFSGSGSGQPEADAPDAKDMIGILKLIDRAQALRKQGKEEQAKAILDQILERDPANKQALRIYGDLHRDLKSYREAESYYKRIIELDPEYGDAQIYLGQLYIDAGWFDDAEALVAQLIADNDRSPKAYRLEGLIHFRRGEFAEARDSFLKAIELFPSYHQALFWLAGTYIELRDFENAYQAIQTASKILPNDPTYRELMLKLRQRI
jgi:arylsulfatase A-like enzyme/Flp pilus assembly protein TadD